MATTPTPTDGQVFVDFTRGTGVTFDTTSSSSATQPVITSVTGGPPGGINASTDGSGAVTLTPYLIIANTPDDLPGGPLPSSATQGLLVYVRSAPGLFFYDPATGNWTAV